MATNKIQFDNLHAIKQLAYTFYDVMDREPEFAELRGLHPKLLNTAKKKLYRIFVHWFGNDESILSEPPNAKMLELRHRHVELSDHHVELWLACMTQTMTTLSLDLELQKQLDHHFSGMIRAMQQRRTTITTSLE